MNPERWNDHANWRLLDEGWVPYCESDGCTDRAVYTTTDQWDSWADENNKRSGKTPLYLCRSHYASLILPQDWRDPIHWVKCLARVLVLPEVLECGWPDDSRPCGQPSVYETTHDYDINGSAEAPMFLCTEHYLLLVEQWGDVDWTAPASVAAVTAMRDLQALL